MNIQLTEGSLSTIIEAHFAANPLWKKLELRTQRGGVAGRGSAGGVSRSCGGRVSGPRPPGLRVQRNRRVLSALLLALPRLPLRISAAAAAALRIHARKRALGAAPNAASVRLRAIGLARGAAKNFIEGQFAGNLVWQILGSKVINPVDPERPRKKMRLLVSDGSHMSTFVMLAPWIVDKFTSGEISDYSVIRVNDFLKVVVSKGTEDKCIIIIKDLTVLAKGTEVGRKIGCPKIHSSSVEPAQNPLSLRMEELSLDDST